MLLFARAQSEHRGDRGNDLQVVEHVLFQRLPVSDHLHAAGIRVVVDHDAVDTGLLVQSFDHYIFLDGLIFSADKIIVEIHVQVVHPPHIGERIEYIDIIDIEGVLRQLQAAVAQHLCPENDRMHENILADRETVGLIPRKNASNGKAAPVLHDLVTVLVFFVIDKVADKKIQGFFLTGETAQHIEDTLISAGTDLVVTVDNLEVKTCGIFNSCIDRSAVAFVGLVNGADNAGMLSLKAVGNLRCAIPGSIIHDQDLHLISSHKKRFDAVFHICFRVVTGNSN